MTKGKQMNRNENRNYGTMYSWLLHQNSMRGMFDDLNITNFRRHKIVKPVQHELNSYALFIVHCLVIFIFI